MRRGAHDSDTPEWLLNAAEDVGLAHTPDEPSERESLLTEHMEAFVQQQKQPDDDSKSRRMHRSVRLSTFDWCLLAFLLLAFLNQRPRGLKILDADAIVTSDAPPIPAATAEYISPSTASPSPAPPPSPIESTAEVAATEQAEEFVPKSNPKSDIEIAAANVAARAAAIKASQATAEPSAPSILSITNDKLQSLVDAWALPSQRTLALNRHRTNQLRRLLPTRKKVPTGLLGTIATEVRSAETRAIAAATSESSKAGRNARKAL